MTIESISANKIEITKIDGRKEGDCEYALYAVSTCNAEKYLLSVSDRTSGDIEMIGGNAWQAKEFFTLICDNKASCGHLADLADDYRKMLCQI